jgi:hypothetical protein
MDEGRGRLGCLEPEGGVDIRVSHHPEHELKRCDGGMGGGISPHGINGCGNDRRGLVGGASRPPTSRPRPSMFSWYRLALPATPRYYGLRLLL